MSSGAEALRFTDLQATVDRSSKPQRAGLIREGSLYVKTLSESNSAFQLRKQFVWANNLRWTLKTLEEA